MSATNAFRIAHLPTGADPASLIADRKTGILQAALNSTTPLLHDLIDTTLDRFNLDEVWSTARAIDAVSRLVDQFAGAAERRTAIQYLATRLNRSEDHIERELDESTPIRTRRRNLDRGIARSPW